MREGLRAARDHRGLDHNDPPSPIIWNKVGALTPALRSGSAPARARSALSSTPSLSPYTLPFLRSLSQAHISLHPEMNRSSPAFWAPLPSARPRSRTPGTGRETRGQLEPTQHHPQRLRPPRAAAARVGVWIGYHCPRDAPGPGARADRPLPILEAPDSGDPWALGKNRGTRRTRFESSRSQVSDLGTGYTWRDRRANPYLQVFSLAPWEESGSYVG